MIVQAEESMEWNDMRMFYKTVNGVRRKIAPWPVMCNDHDGNLLTDKTINDGWRVERTLQGVALPEFKSTTTYRLWNLMDVTRGRTAC